MNQKGIVTFEFAEADKRKVNDAYTKVSNEWVSEQEGAGRPARAMLADIRRLKAAYESLTPDQRMQKILQSPVSGTMPLKQ